MVHISMLPQDFYRYMEKQHTLVGEHSRKTFRIGDSVRVKLAGVSSEKKQIDFVLVETARPDTDGYLSGSEEYPKIPVRGKRLGSTGKRGGRRKS
jgi:ribonuclease R